jgi:hypothetical protein
MERTSEGSGALVIVVVVGTVRGELCSEGVCGVRVQYTAKMRLFFLKSVVWSGGCAGVLAAVFVYAAVIAPLPQSEPCLFLSECSKSEIARLSLLLRGFRVVSMAELVINGSRTFLRAGATELADRRRGQSADFLTAAVRGRCRAVAGVCCRNHRRPVHSRQSVRSASLTRLDLVAFFPPNSHESRSQRTALASRRRQLRQHECVGFGCGRFARVAAALARLPALTHRCGGAGAFCWLQPSGLLSTGTAVGRSQCDEHHVGCALVADELERRRTVSTAFKCHDLRLAG